MIIKPSQIQSVGNNQLSSFVKSQVDVLLESHSSAVKVNSAEANVLVSQIIDFCQMYNLRQAKNILQIISLALFHGLGLPLTGSLEVLFRSTIEEDEKMEYAYFSLISFRNDLAELILQ